MRQASVESTADAYLELLAARGVDYFFGNGGTDFGPIVEAYAKRSALEQPMPKPVTAPHEITATSMAAGYAMVTGRPQVVMVHTFPGTANATGGLINARSNQVPMLFTAGRQPRSESKDQGGMVREWVKWDSELRSSADLEDLVDRALAITQSEPRGPVYLSLPREVLAEETASFSYSETARSQPGFARATEESIEAVAALLAGAARPVVLTSALGRDPAAVPELVRLAELLGMPVFCSGGSPVSCGTYMSFPVTHAMHQGTQAGEAVREADVVLVAEQDVSMAAGGISRDAIVVGIGADPLFSVMPQRALPVNHSLAGSPRHTLRALNDAVSRQTLDSGAIEARRELWGRKHAESRQSLKDRALAGAEKAPLSKAWVSYCFEQVRNEQTTFVSELGLDMTQMEFTQPGQFYGISTAGVLGWAPGAGLGAKLAAPDRTVIVTLGDGSYMFGAPEAAHWVSRKMGLPVLFAVWNNARWNAVENATRNGHREGWAARTGQYAFTDLSPPLDFEMICQSAGGYGERVEDPREVPAAIERALHAVRVEKRQALLNFIGE